MHLLFALLLTAAPVNSADACDKLWDDTVAAAAPDLDPTDDLRKSYLANEKAALVRKCRASDAAMLACPGQASARCSKDFPRPPDGGRALGLATCIWPEVQDCAQRAYVDGAKPVVDALLGELEAGSVAPQKSLLKLTGPRALLSLRGEALAEKRGDGWWLLLVSYRVGARLRGVLLRSPHAAPLRAGKLTFAGVPLEVSPPSPDGARAYCVTK